MNKYKAKKVTHSGYSFASQGEAACFATLKLLEREGSLSEIEAQVHVYLTRARIAYIADFKATDTKANAKIWIEFKGFETPLWRLKRRLWMFYGPGPLHVYKMGRGRIYLDEIITPQISKDDLLSIETI